jgi:hypothetical protein
MVVQSTVLYCKLSLVKLSYESIGWLEAELS